MSFFSHRMVHGPTCVHRKVSPEVDIWISYKQQGLIQDFFAEGEIQMCHSVPRLGESWGMLPQENFEIAVYGKQE